MKMVKSLLLGTATGLVAMTGAQAADLPVKAKPVQYVKICSLYGAGFYYIPGTDMCLKMGGWVRTEAAVHTNGSSTGVFNNDVNNRNTNNMWWRIRGYITADARNQTEYGTVRSYIAVGLSTNTTGLDNAANQFDANKAFIQFAGFTFGRATSFYDFYSASFNSYFGFNPQSDTGDGGQNVMAYTAQLGGGLSATVSAESRRMTQLVNQNLAAVVGGANNIAAGTFSTTGSTVSGASAYGGWQIPDVIANLRVDQAWGSAQVMGAYHQVNAGYYGATLENSGHPGDKAGFVLGAGVKLLVPMIGAGDYIWGQVNYTQGALRYLFQNPGAGNYWLSNGQNASYGVMSDGVYGGTIAGGTNSGIELTTAWGVNAAYEHIWNKSWRTSAHGGYYAVSYNSAANAMLCSAQATTAITSAANGAGAGTASVAGAGCNNNWSQWWVGSRTQFNLDANTYLGVDIAYSAIKSMTTTSGTVLAAANAGSASSPWALGTQGNWMGRFRVHRDFYP